MPKDLAALLAEDGAVPADVIERALARQQEAGGTLDTALLELGAIAEDAVAAWLARAAELPAAPPAAWDAADARARRVFPSRVAERHGLAPFALDGRELSLVATYPVDLGLLDEISFMLSLHLTAHVGPEWRVRELIHRVYGTPLSPRLAAVAASVRAAAGADFTAPEPPPAEPDAPDAGEASPLDALGEREAEASRAPDAAPLAAFGDGAESMEPLAAALAEALESVDLSDFEVDEEPAASPAAADGAPAQPPEDGGDEAEPQPDEPAAPPDRSAPPRWTLEDARAAVAAARHRDEVVLAALRYTRDFFEFAAMFAVTRDAVAGHDALGVEEEARERARAVAIWASDPGFFKTVIETQSPYLGPVQAGAAGTDAVLHGLGRTPRTVLVFPIALRARPVCVLYADNGEAPVSPRRLGDLLLFLSTVGPAFERIIRDRKRRRRRRAAGAPASAASLSRAGAPAEQPERASAAAEAPPAHASPSPTGGAEIGTRGEAAVDSGGPLGGGDGEAEDAAEMATEVPLDDLSLSPAAAPEAQPERTSTTADLRAAASSLSPAGGEEIGAHGEAALTSGGALGRGQGAEAAGEDEGALSFASLDAAGDAEAAPLPPRPAPARPRPALPTDPGRTAILWPTARPADDLAALEDRFFAGGTPAAPIAPIAPLPAAPAAAAAEPPKEAAAQPAARARAAEPGGAPPVAAPPDPAQLSALADRALEPDPDGAAAACAALGNRRRDPAIRPAAEKLRRALLSGLAARAAQAARALAAVRDQDAIPLLIQVLETSDPETARAAADALAAITLQRLGPDARRWLAWWKENRGRGRAQWLFSALTSPDRELRVAASLELSHAAPPPVAYTADMPPPEREKAARAWAGWWARSGHVL